MDNLELALYKHFNIILDGEENLIRINTDNNDDSDKTLYIYIIEEEDKLTLMCAFARLPDQIDSLIKLLTLNVESEVKFGVKDNLIIAMISIDPDEAVDNMANKVSLLVTQIRNVEQSL